jgi:hypothetical protein
MAGTVPGGFTNKNTSQVWEMGNMPKNSEIMVERRNTDSPIEGDRQRSFQSFAGWASWMKVAVGAGAFAPFVNSGRWDHNDSGGRNAPVLRDACGVNHAIQPENSHLGSLGATELQFGRDRMSFDGHCPLSR